MFVLFFLLWIVFNGQITLEIAIFGLVIAAVMYAFCCKFMDFNIAQDVKMAKKSGLLLLYVVTLIKEILKANFATIRMISTSRYEIEPKIIKFKTHLKSKTARVLLANSITLTPGTITVYLEEDELCVHCLDKDFSEGIEDSVFVKLLEKLEAD